jgi:hypothetical protein
VHPIQLDEREQEIRHLHSQTTSIDHVCSRISEELESVLGKHEYLKQLREHTKDKETWLKKYVLRKNHSAEKLKKQTFPASESQKVNEETPIIDILKRNLEKKLKKLRFLQSVAEGVKAGEKNIVSTLAFKL